MWSVGLLVAALTLPFYSNGATLVDENGQGVLLIVAVPAIVTAVVWLALWHKCSHGDRLSTYVAWLAISLLALFCLAGMFTIGFFVVPVAILLAAAASRTPSGPPEAPTPTA
jgi:hypothetical protein